MPYEQRDNSGTLFVNSRKKSAKHPDRDGTAMIGGKIYRVSGWLKDGKNGQFLSLSFSEAKPRDDQQTHQSDEAPF